MGEEELEGGEDQMALDKEEEEEVVVVQGVVEVEMEQGLLKIQFQECLEKIILYMRLYRTLVSLVMDR